ncbi:unnamed protein product [Ixodes persulcatus]
MRPASLLDRGQLCRAMRVLFRVVAIFFFSIVVIMLSFFSSIGAHNAIDMVPAQDCNGEPHHNLAALDPTLTTCRCSDY